jgi:amino-acid N-acetyltransferase
MPIEIRPATLRDLSPLARLIAHYAKEGILLPRTEFELAESVRDFRLALSAEGVLTGCGALHVYTPLAGEIRSLAVVPESHGAGVGRALVETLAGEARSLGLKELFAFTYVPEFFSRVGFSTVDRAELPLKAWKDCLRCPKFRACDEIAVRRTL